MQERNPTPDSPESRLFAAVILQAVDDLLCPHGLVPGEVARDRSDALAFLTATSGMAARDRRDVCHAAGFDPDAIRQKIIAILEGAPFDIRAGRSGQGKRDVAVAARKLEEARALWRQQKAPPPSTRRETHDRRALAERVLRALEQGQMSTNLLAITLCCSRAQVQAICVNLVTAGKLVRLSKFTFSLPDWIAPEELRARAAAYEPEPMDVIRARSEQYLKELEAQRAAA